MYVAFIPPISTIGFWRGIHSAVYQSILLNAARLTLWVYAVYMD
jgi:hypothetical protein